MRMRDDHIGIGELAKVVVWRKACEHVFDEIDECLSRALLIALLIELSRPNIRQKRLPCQGIDKHCHNLDKHFHAQDKHWHDLDKHCHNAGKHCHAQMCVRARRGGGRGREIS